MLLLKQKTKVKKMAKETKAQRMEREAREQEERLEQLRTEYFPKLMTTLERASKNDMQLFVRDGHFYVCRGNESDSWAFPAEYTETSNNLLWNLNYELELKEEAAREEERRYQVKQAALAKLTKEEKELLGL